jgi:hypothetical protein
MTIQQLGWMRNDAKNFLGGHIYSSWGGGREGCFQLAQVRTDGQQMTMHYNEVTDMWIENNKRVKTIIAGRKSRNMRI